ncbi:tetratricopeptide repeat protein [Shouchella lonarensis]|uniref:Tetratricopeptide repeat-containing protein n=1 Tax=Shouchella lonarensis TaxID=1464122 RepID=A0A1G6HV81_9BACI|nr:tetratricopeptide repeat protein [Shouchella lonarensis]SDB98100.1 Tetratricopeptide repeat-containing protein [Shouchella lonarensis]
MSDRYHSKQTSNIVVPFHRSGDYFFHKGLTAFKKKHLHQAVKQFERAIKRSDNEPAFQVQLAIVLTELGEYERANEILQNVLYQGEEQQEICHFLIASNAAYLGYFSQAKHHAERYLQLEPEGECAEEAQRLIDVCDNDLLFTSSYQEEDEHLLDLHAQALEYMETSKLDHAMRILEDITNTYPAYWAAQNHLAEVVFRKGEYARAFSLCETILKAHPNNLLTHCNLALFHDKLGHATKVAQYKQLLPTILPMDIDHAIRLVEVLCTLGQYREVMKRPLLAFTHGEDHVQLLRCYGVAAYHTGDRARATSLLKKAAERGCHMSSAQLNAIKQQQSQQITFSPF